MKKIYNFSQIDDFFNNQLSSAKMFSRIDLCLGYYQIWIIKGDEKNIVYHTRSDY
jgi:hypothetical protein